MVRIGFDRTLLILGFGCIGQGVLPLLLRHVDFDPMRLIVASASSDGRAQVEAVGGRFVHGRLTPDNLAACLGECLSAGDFLLNLSVDVASRDLLAWCHAHAVDYLDTCIEPWAGRLLDTRLAPALRTSRALRAEALALRGGAPWRSTALLAHGANPGLSFHFLKRALLDVAALCGVPTVAAPLRADWARLARRLDVRVIHIAEHDDQRGGTAGQADEFVNTWSAQGLLGESCQPAELGWGSHEVELPAGANRVDGGSASIHLDRPGAATHLHGWTPGGGSAEAFLISLVDVVTMSEYLGDDPAGGSHYRPTVCYAYRPCTDAAQSLRELVQRGLRPPPRQRVLKEELNDGGDELGVLLLGPRFGAYWYGSRLSLRAARALAPHNSATSLQVAAGVLAGVVWVIGHPRAGLVEPSDLPHDEVLDIAAPYLGELHGVRSEWRPPAGRGDDWQFSRFAAGW